MDSKAGAKVNCKACGTSFVAADSTQSSAATVVPPTSERLAAARSMLPQIGRFQTTTPLGAGAFGAVYRAYDPLLEREVALKVPHPELVDNPRAVERFLRESKAAAQLRHPHIVPVYDAGQQGGQYFIASAFIEGATLATLSKDGGLGFRRAAQIVRDLAEALAYAHGRGIVHRDVKPANVMVDSNGDALLMDFGLARVDRTSEQLTKDGAILGTPLYMAPEQAKGDSSAVGAKSDQYSLGVTLYELLCGQTPFAGSAKHILYNVAYEEPPSPRTVNPSIPFDLEAICAKATAKALDRRYRDCREFADDLSRWLNGELTRARQLRPLERLWRWTNRHKAVAGLTAAVVLLMVLITIGSVVSASRLALEQHNTNHALNQARQETVRAETETRRAEELAQRAEGESTRAQTEKQRADKEAQEALSALAIAQQKTQEAKDSLKVANDQTAIAQQKTRELEQQFYIDGIGLAYREWQHAHLDEAKRILDLLPAHLRGWEWGYCKRLCHSELLTLGGHNTPLHVVAYSPKGDMIAAASAADGILLLWDLTSPERTQRVLLPPKPPNGIHAIAFSPDGLRVAAARQLRFANERGTPNGVIHVIETLSGKELHTIPSGTVATVCFSKDGKYIASLSDGADVAQGAVSHSLWDSSTGASVSPQPVVLSVTGSCAFSPGCAISPNGRWIATAASVGRNDVIVYDAVSGRETRRFTTPTERPLNPKLSILRRDEHRQLSRTMTVAFAPDSTRLATGNYDGTITIWDVAKGVRLLGLQGSPETSSSLAFSPDGEWIASGQGDAMTLWDTSTGRELLTLRAHDGLAEVRFSVDGARLASAGYDGTVKVWDSTARPEFLVLRKDHYHVRSVSFSPDGNRVLVGGLGDADVKSGLAVWDLTTGKESLRVEKAYLAQSPVYSPDGRWIASVKEDIITLVNSSNANNVRSILRYDPVHFRGRGRPGRPGTFDTLAFSHDGQLVAAATADDTVKLWKVNTGEEVQSVHWPDSTITCAAFSPGGERLAAGSKDSALKLWDTKSGKEIVSINLDTGVVTSIFYSGDGKCIAVSGKSGLVTVCDAASGVVRCRTQRKVSGWNVTEWRMALSPDGKRAATLSSADGLTWLTIWDAMTGQELFGFEPFPGGIGRDVTFSHDGGKLAIAAGSSLYVLDGTWPKSSLQAIGDEATQRHRERTN
ncbi:MAG: DUF874 family protein [Planctomycetes bacterium]|nr:DUF874 family protein [Planctomycetota bacterium]